MTVDLDKLVDDLLAANLARIRARNQREQQHVDAPKALPPAAAKPARSKREPKPPISEPRHEVTTLLTRSEVMALERMARAAGVTKETMLRWCLQAYAAEIQCRNGS